MYDFDTIIDRTGTGSEKFAIMPECVKKAGVLPLSVADMEFSAPPKVKEALKTAAEHGICGYTGIDDAYFEALRGFQMRRHGFEVQRDWLFVTSGVVNALGTAVRALSNKGDGVIIQPPVYPPFFNAVRVNERVLLENPLIYKNGRYEMDFEGLKTLCRRPEAKLMILCSPHNPVGRVWTAKELLRLGEICKSNGVAVIADEIHQDIILKENTHTCIAALPDMADNCVICTAMSKTFNLAGLACSNIFVPGEALRRRFKAQMEIEGNECIPYFARAAAIAAFSVCDDWLEELLEYVWGNFELMYSFIAGKLPKLSIIRAEGTFLAWVDMHALGLNDAELETLVTEHGLLALDEGYIFGKEGCGFERWNIAVPRAELKRALMRLEKAVKSSGKA